MARHKRYVYFFGEGHAEGREIGRNLLGNKGAGLADMTRLGIRVPAGFTISTEACREYYTNHRTYPPGLWEEVLRNLKRVEKCMGATFGDPGNPLLVSVRSGAPVSMPGMMDTVLNVGLNNETVQGLIRKSKNPRFAWDAYRRFVTMFSCIVMGMKRERFENILVAKKKALMVHQDDDIPAAALTEMVAEYTDLVRLETGRDFPQDPLDQLRMSINAVLESWNSPRAIVYRRLNNIPHHLGTAVSIVAMVFGNMGETSGTGVAFTRDPATGEKRLFGECLMNAQGEDVVSGVRTPLSISSLHTMVPKAYQDLQRIAGKLETHYRDMQDIEFTIQEGTLYMLQTRTGKRTGPAALKIACDMQREGVISQEEAVLRVTPEHIEQLLYPIFDQDKKKEAVAAGRLLGKGLNAGPGAAAGEVVFSAEDAVRAARKGTRVILVRKETSPEDIEGMVAAEAIVTATGGMTSHAAVVARGMGKTCVVGISVLHIDEERKEARIGKAVLREGDSLSVDGTTGEVILGTIPSRPSEIIQVLVEKSLRPEKSALYQRFEKLLTWADRIRRMKVRANADTSADAHSARAFGAEGIGLCRTEHMFFQKDRVRAVREMILANTPEERRKALAKILPMQKGDFTLIFKEMAGLPVTIRLLDPPLHEFLPHTEAELEDISREMGVPVAVLRAKNDDLKEFNPMLGHRGCRLGVTFPEIYEIQVQAIFEAACELAKEKVKVIPEVMIPLVSHIKELDILAAICRRVAREVMDRMGVKVKYSIGTMIELPRASLVADQIARTAEFFSFGTNDLTQTTYGLSRDDAGKFLPYYIEHGLFERDPFAALDQEGVGLLMKMGIEKGRSTRPDLKVGICGEHGGEPSSVEFCHTLGLDYVSCSPYRVPIARLSAAQALLKEKKGATSKGRPRR